MVKLTELNVDMVFEMLQNKSSRVVFMILQSDDYTSLDLSNKFKVPRVSVYRAIASLLKTGLVRVKKYNVDRDNLGKKEAVYTTDFKVFSIDFVNGKVKLDGS